MSTKVIILVAVLVLFLGGVLLLRLLFHPEITRPVPSIPIQSPSSNPNVVPSSNPSFTPLPYASSHSAYSNSSLDQDFQRITTHIPLSDQDQTVRTNLINSLGEKSGTLTETSEFMAEYDKAPNEFMVELKINNADQAKLDAEGWFKQQGLSTQGICNLPVVFYLSSEVDQYYKSNNLNFNPIPDGCQ